MAKDCDPRIIDTVLTAATTVHKVLGPGLLESIYERALHIELQASGVPASAQVEVPIRYNNVDLGLGFRLDLIVAGQLIVEVKSVSKLDVVHFKQLRSYLRATGIGTGFILNFNEALMKSGIRRVSMD